MYWTYVFFSEIKSLSVQDQPPGMISTYLYRVLEDTDSPLPSSLSTRGFSDSARRKKKKGSKMCTLFASGGPSSFFKRVIVCRSSTVSTLVCVQRTKDEVIKVSTEKDGKNKNHEKRNSFDFYIRKNLAIPLQWRSVKGIPLFKLFNKFIGEKRRFYIWHKKRSILHFCE